MEHLPHAPVVVAFTEGRLSFDDLVAAIRLSGTPLIEAPVDGYCKTTFVHIETDSHPGASYRVGTTIDRAYSPNQLAMEALDSGVHAVTVMIPSHLRFSYAIERLASDGNSTIVHDRFAPRSPVPDRRLSEAIAVMPDARPLPYLGRAGKVAPPRLDEVRITSTELGAERCVWLSPPQNESDTPLSVVVIFDGTADHSAPAVREALMEEGLIVPTLVVLIDQEDRRDQDLPASLPFSRFLAYELLPFVREQYDVSISPADVVLSGSSYGGLCAGWTALNFPEVFGGAILQSASCWYHPELRRPEGFSPISAPTPTLIATVESRPAAPVRIYQEVGELELGPPPAQVWQIHGNRWLHSALQAKGYATHYREFGGGHDAAWWRGTWADAMIWMLPSG